MYVALDTVDLAAYSAPTVSIWAHIDSTGYEDSDIIRAWAECSDGSVVDVVNGVLDDAAHPVGASGAQMTENEWVPHIAALPASCGSVTVKFGCQTNANSEECWFVRTSSFLSGFLISQSKAFACAGHGGDRGLRRTPHSPRPVRRNRLRRPRHVRGSRDHHRHLQLH